MLVRLILIGVAVAAAIYLLRLVLSPRHTRAAPPARAGASQTMVKCQACGLHVPQDEALYREGRPYCSEAHLPRNPS